MKKITVNTSKSYDITIMDGSLEVLSKELNKVIKSKNVAIITDTNVNEIYALAMSKMLGSTDFCSIKYVIESGEASKTLDTYGKIINFLAENNFTRKDTIIAIGGGVVGDIAGFVAGTYMRGVDFVQVPTTLLGMVDSSVGGKTAVDLDYGKNLVGVFHQPVAVFILPKLLETLPKTFVDDGMGEVLKYAILRGGKLYDNLMNSSIDYMEVISECVSIKAKIVARDEFDIGERQLLNLGHTFGHAIEQISGYKVTHGVAVAQGLKYALRLSKQAGVLKNGEREINMLLDKYLVGECVYPLNELQKFMMVDKKKCGDKINFALIEGLGQCVIKALSLEESLCE